VAPGPRITAAPRTNQLLIAGTAAEIRDALELIKALDVPVAAMPAVAPESGPVPAVIMTRSGNARDIANTLNNLSGSSQLWTSPSGQRPTFLAHSTTVLLVAAPERVLPAIRELVRSLEPEPGVAVK
jgi:type II secretory pathway component GspD/PulD (secretin)